MKALLCKLLGHKWVPRDWKATPMGVGDVIGNFWVVRCDRCNKRQ